MERKRRFAYLLLMGILTLLGGMFGCEGRSIYTADELTGISISCGQMDIRCCYSFALAKGSNDSWLFSSNCFINGLEREISIDECEISSEDVEEIISIVREKGLIERLQKQKKPLRLGFVSDEESFSAHMSFSDGGAIDGDISLSGELEDCFYRLAEKYSKE